MFKFVKVFNQRAGDVAVIDRNAPCKTDSNKNKIIKSTFNVATNEINTFLAHHTLVVPAYLIEIKSEIDVIDFVFEVLYSVLRVKWFKRRVNINIIHKNTEKFFFKYLDDELNANYNADIRFINKKFDYKMRSTLQ